MKGIPDFSYLNEVSGGDYSIMLEFIQIFKEQLPEFVQQLNEAIENKNYQAVAAIAHKAKSTVSIFGMHEWATLLKQVQLDINQGIIPDNLKQMVVDFEKDGFEIIEEAIKYAEKNK
ncbi:MAG TPA: Hpt domain-containing protein [Bacteroidales bacterium]|jgi:HPt (histidine-containing phosphotransfer) domain-containing protein|nr:Hpt domain-containing protein [Bacteroidales bacterium]HNV94981.1 Hpt domain-containing protein [Bacteroidales bacterium]